ncbi:nitroreductase family protein [Spirillospora sp. NPDC029432]|uniref:nitroreductase family protein n=1 Tax=Spirillospora sp. NPDC029432 TaxID=3154599 RepID=UPI0034542AFD
MTPDELLTTTRSVRLGLDFEKPVDTGVLRECVALALQAPNGHNDQLWHWIVVTDPGKRSELSGCYAQAARPVIDDMGRDPAKARLHRASAHLADHMARAPALVVVCLQVPPEALAEQFTALGYRTPVEHLANSVYYGSVWPAVWSFMLALRSRGLASAVTALHLAAECEAARILQLPDGVTQCALLAVAHPKDGVFKRGPRKQAEEVLHWNTWQ